MNRLSILVTLLFVPFYHVNASEVSSSIQFPTASMDETTDTSDDFYDPLNSEEAYDPQKDYSDFRDFKNSYAKLYKLSEMKITPPPPPALQPLQQNLFEHSQRYDADIDDHDSDASTNSNVSTAFDVDDGDNDDAIISTTNPAAIEPQTTVQLVMESAPHEMNEIFKNTPAPVETNEMHNNAEFLFGKQAKTAYVPVASESEEPVNRLSFSENGIQKAASNVYHRNKSNNNSKNNNNNNNNSDDDTSYYVNDGNNDNSEAANYSQPITLPYLMDTTITSLPSSPVFISTKAPAVLLTTSTVSTPITSTTTTTTTSTITAATAAAAVAITPNQPSGKKSAKKIEALPRVYKYSADEILRKYLDDTFIRAPLATLINTAPEPLRKAKMLWKSALRPNTPIDIVLVAFNSSGVGVTYSFKNTRTMIAGLESVQESREMSEGGSGFYGILRASELVPYDSAIFISTDKIPQDISLMKYVATTLLKKRIRLYLIWLGGEHIYENETSDQIGGVLGEVAIRSGGEIFRITEEQVGSGDLRLITNFLQNDIQGAQVLDIPVNTTASNLYIKIQGNIEHATLTTPNGGIEIDLLDSKSVNSFSPGSFAFHLPFGTFDEFEIIVNLNVSSSGSKGVYILKIAPRINHDAEMVESFYILVREDSNQHLEMSYGDSTQNDITNSVGYGPLFRAARSENLSEANEDDDDDDDNIKWPEPQTDDNRFDETTISSNDTKISLRNAKTTLQAVTKIELGTQSQLLPHPGATVQIHYEITNLRDEPTFHNFQVVDEQRFLRSLNPPSMWLPPGQSSTAVVTCYIPPNIDVGTKDKITFSSQGLSLASQSAIMTVSSPQSAGVDRRAPTIYWDYGSRCYGHIEAGRCAGSIWSLDITTVDYETGILRIQSNPKGGLFVLGPFIAGTTQEVKASYTASCCSPQVSITSYDLAGNQRTVTVDVSEYILSAVEIVAIVLGVILLIILIVVIVAAIVYCCKKRRESRELPVYRSRADRERAT